MRASLLLFAALLLGAACAGAQEQFSRTVSTGPTGTVTVENLSGRVRVVGWNRNEIQVTGTLGSRVQRVDVRGSGNRTTIEVELPGNLRNQCNRGACDADLEIRVPARKDVEVETVSAGIAVTGVTGSVAAESTSGSVVVEGSPSRVEAGSTSGEVRVNATTAVVEAETTSGSIAIAGTVRESVTAESVSGSVTVQAGTPELSAETVSGSLAVHSVSRRASVSTVSGSAVVRGTGIQYLSFESVSGQLRFEGSPRSDAAFNIESHSGSVELRLPASVSAEFDVSTFSGDISNAFGPAATRTDRYAPGQELRFTAGRGGGMISVRTFSGSVRLIRQ